MTTPLYLGHAIVAANTDLDLLQQTATNAAATAVAAAGTANSLLGIVPSPALGRTVATLQNYINHSAMLWLGDYGVVGDGFTDDTAAVQAALSAGATYQRVVYGGGLTCKVTAALTCAGPGLVFDSVDYGVLPHPGIYVTGSGYTALTCTGVLAQFRVSVYGTGNAANGILFQNPQRGFVQQVRVYNLNGFGIKINKCYDMLWGALSVELCGNASEYAFSVNDDGDTSNMSHFLHIQCEVANRKAIYIAPATLACVFDSIHSERAIPNAADITWFFGGNSCQYNSLRVNSQAPATDAKARFAGTETTYTVPIVEGAIDTNLEGIGGYSITVVGPNFQGTTHAQPSQIGTINILGGAVASLQTDAFTFRVTGTKIGSLGIGYANNDPTQAVFVDCEILALGSASATSAATFVRCLIRGSSSFLQGVTIFQGSDVTNASGVTHTTGLIEAHDSIIRASITYYNNSPIRLYDTTVTGMIAVGDGGLADVLIDDGSTIGAGSTGVGVPTGGAHVAGARHRNAIPAVGNPLGWTCTAAGTPGTWIAEANL